MTVDCPHCGKKTEAKFGALAGSGIINPEGSWCGVCGKPFTVTASIDVRIEKRQA
jgi:hypothetical protein